VIVIAGEMTVVKVAAAASVLVACYKWMPYVKSVLDGTTRPHRLGWCVFLMMDGIVVVAQLLDGGLVSVLASMVALFYSAVIFALSLRADPLHRSPMTHRSDWILFALALGVMALWALTRSNALAIWLTVVGDFAGTVMIIGKVYREPNSEVVGPWVAGTAACGLSCITLLGARPGILYVWPIYGLLSNAALVGAIRISGRESRRASSDPMDKGSSRDGLSTGVQHVNAI
jgi:hypothetical protein